VFLRQLEQVDGSVEIVFDQLPAARGSIHAREHARVRGGVDDPIDCPDGFEVAGRAHVGVKKFHASFPQRLDVEMAAGAAEIIEPDDLGRGIKIEQTSREAASGKTANARDQNLHPRKSIINNAFAARRIYPEVSLTDLPLRASLSSAIAMASISTRAFFGNAETSTVDRAGGWSVK
jgi:hypothetical protein